MVPSQLYQLTVKDEPTVEDKREVEHIPYKEATGQLLYLSGRKKPDIAFAVGILSLHVSKPKPIKWAAVKRLFGI